MVRLTSSAREVTRAVTFTVPRLLRSPTPARSSSEVLPQASPDLNTAEELSWTCLLRWMTWLSVSGSQSRLAVWAGSSELGASGMSPWSPAVR